jgi:mono/diheme cytochrome c family protein
MDRQREPRDRLTSCLPVIHFARVPRRGSRQSWRRSAWPLALALACSAWSARAAATGDASRLTRGAQIYQQACAACHGPTGTGAPRSQVAFALPLPDFTDCNFYVREANTDWLAIIHEGGPARGFDRMMPAFGEALTADQIEQVVAHLRSFCKDDGWPRGELNLPRAMFTEKAYPEDELVLTTGIALAGAGAITNELVYEKRFGPLTQIEIALPFAYQHGGPTDAGWQLGLGDVAFGVKRVLLQSLRTGSILSISGELGLATGDARRGFGLGTPTFAPYFTFGQLVTAAGFFQVQGGVELPFHTDRAEQEAFLRAAVGRTFTEGFGRAWTPMLELVATRAFSSGADIAWDLVPQCQVTLSSRHHVMASAAVRAPVQNPGASTSLYLYLLWDFFDGGFLEGW